VLPSATLSKKLAEARRQGESFQDAWPVALEAALAGEPNRRQRGEWQMIFTDQVDVWRGAYERHGPADRSGLALRRLEDSDAVSDRQTVTMEPHLT